LINHEWAKKFNHLFFKDGLVTPYGKPTSWRKQERQTPTV